MGESPAPPSPTTTKNRKELEIMKRNHAQSSLFWEYAVIKILLYDIPNFPKAIIPVCRGRD